LLQYWNPEKRFSSEEKLEDTKKVIRSCKSPLPNEEGPKDKQ
jgi:hypothetical protein